MMKNKLFIFINIFGLAISIACCLVAFFLYDFNASFDTYHKNASTIYRIGSIREFQGSYRKYAHTPLALGNVIKQNVTDLDKVVRFNLGFFDFKVGDDVFNNTVGFADKDFFNLFTYEFLEGNGNLTNTNQIIISEEIALKHFGRDKVLGKILTQSLDSGRSKSYTISGVFKIPPSNTSFYAPVFILYDNQFANGNKDENSWVDRTNLFVQISDPTRIDAIKRQIDVYTVNNNQAREDFLISEF